MNFSPEPGSTEYLALRECLRQPIAEIFEAAALLSDAADAHLAGENERAASAIETADIPAIRDWIESLWGKRRDYPDKVHYLRVRPVEFLSASLAREERVPARGPGRQLGQQIIAKFGWNCAYCRIPLIARSGRDILRHSYPSILRWGRTNDEKHTAFMCMDNEFDHVVPHSRGGTNGLENLVPCCAPCNCGKENWTLGQLGLIDPRVRNIGPSAWDGLTRLTNLA